MGGDDPRAAGGEGTSPDGIARAGLTTATARYLEVIGRLAAELTASGEVELVQELLAEGSRVLAGARGS